MTPDDNPLADALDSAVNAAEGAIQATWAIWHLMTPAEQDGWLAFAAISWPRRDVFLKTILPAAEQIVDDERQAG
jgi:hypothetical protein